MTDPSWDAASPGAVDESLAPVVNTPARSDSVMKRRFSFVTDLLSSALARTSNYVERALQAVQLTLVDAELKRRAGSPGLEMGKFNLNYLQHDNTLSKKQVGDVGELVRDVNASIFTAAAYDAIERMKNLDMTRWFNLPRYHMSPVRQNGNLYFTVGNHGSPLNGFANESRAGHYGAEVSRAMVELNNVLFKALEPVGKSIQGDLVNTMMPAHTFQTSPDMALKEGLVTIMQAIDILIAKEVQSASPKTLDEILDAIAESGIVNHMAAFAPFGVVGPLSRRMAETQGMGAAISENGRVTEPQAFLDEARTMMASRQGMPSSRSETLKGCPLGFKSVVVGSDGRAQMTEHPPLGEITKVYISLVKQVMKIHAQRGWTPGPAGA
jgi:hypothetical protein